jgi:hypothetical protein
MIYEKSRNMTRVYAHNTNRYNTIDDPSEVNGIRRRHTRNVGFEKRSPNYTDVLLPSV